MILSLSQIIINKLKMKKYLIYLFVILGPIKVYRLTYFIPRWDSLGKQIYDNPDLKRKDLLSQD